MSIKKALVWMLRRCTLTISFFMIFIFVQSIWPLNLKPSSASVSETIMMLFVTCAFSAFVIAELVQRSVGSRYMKVLGCTVFIFGVITVQAINESLFFNDFIGIPVAQQWQMMGMGLMRSLFMAVVAVLLVPSSQAGFEDDIPRRHHSVGNWAFKIIAIALVFPFVYKFFGYFVAWQSSAVLGYYQEGARIDQTQLMVFQVFRGLIWSGMALLALNLIRGKKAEQILYVGLAMGILHSIQIIIPNPYMPAEVRYVHLVELFLSITLYGMFAAWGLRKNLFQ